jgi:hypothetical protein
MYLRGSRTIYERQTTLCRLVHGPRAKGFFGAALGWTGSVGGPGKQVRRTVYLVDICGERSATITTSEVQHTGEREEKKNTKKILLIGGDGEGVSEILWAFLVLTSGFPGFGLQLRTLFQGAFGHHNRQKIVHTEEQDYLKILLIGGEMVQL